AGALARGLLDEQPGERAVVQVEALDQESFPGLEARGMVDEDLGELVPARVGHEGGPSPWRCPGPPRPRAARACRSLRPSITWPRSGPIRVGVSGGAHAHYERASRA